MSRTFRKRKRSKKIRISTNKRFGLDKTKKRSRKAPGTSIFRWLFHIPAIFKRKKRRRTRFLGLF